MNALKLKFTSGNDIPVESKVVTRTEFEAIVEEFERMAKERDEWKTKAETLGNVIARLWETVPLTSYHLAPLNAEHSKALRALTELVNAACRAEKQS